MAEIDWEDIKGRLSGIKEVTRDLEKSIYEEDIKWVGIYSDLIEVDAKGIKKQLGLDKLVPFKK